MEGDAQARRRHAGDQIGNPEGQEEDPVQPEAEAHPPRGQRVPEWEAQANRALIFPFIMVPDLNCFLLMKLMCGVFFAFSTNFVPDEFWQTTEVAYLLSFKKGHLTWEWYQGIRSYLIPAFLSLYYNTMDALGLITGTHLLIMGPQILQGFLTILGLKLYYEFCLRRMGAKVGRLAYYFMLMNWFTSYCAARTITNQTEMSLNMICLYLLNSGEHVFFTVVLVCNFYIRPTSAVFWIPFLPEFLKKFTFKQIIAAVIVAIVMTGYLTALDIFYYKRVIFTPWEFFKFNFLSAGNEEFGVHHYLWYFYSGMPSILGPTVIVLPIGLFMRGETRKFSFFVLFYMTVFSYIGHKEIRFLLPVLPLVFIVLASASWEVCLYCRRWNLFGSEIKRQQFVQSLLTTFVLINCVVAFFLGMLHLRGFRTAAFTLQEELTGTHHSPEIWIVAPCYSMPVYTYINDHKAKYVFYICPPSKYQKYYDTDRAASSYWLQNDTFNPDDMLADMQYKQLGRGSPDWIITYKEWEGSIVNALSRADNATTYLERELSKHSYIGEFNKRVVLLQRIDKRLLVTRIADKKYVYK